MPRAPSVIFLRKCHLTPGGRLKQHLHRIKNAFRSLQYLRSWAGLRTYKKYEGKLIKSLRLEEKVPSYCEADEVIFIIFNICGRFASVTSSTAIAVPLPLKGKAKGTFASKEDYFNI